MASAASISGIFYGLNVPPKSELIDACIKVDSTKCKALGVVSPFSLFNHVDMGIFIYQQRPKGSSCGIFCGPSLPPNSMPVANSQVSQYNHRDIGLFLYEDKDVSSSFTLDDGVHYVNDDKPKTAQNGRGKKSPLSETSKLQAMQGDGENLYVEELRSILITFGKVVSSCSLSARSVSWECVKKIASQKNVDPARIFDPNNADKSLIGSKKAKKAKLLDMFSALKTILLAICKERPDYMKKYEEAAALAKEESKLIGQVSDSSEVTIAMVPVWVQQYDGDTIRSATAATSAARVKKQSKRHAASSTSSAVSPVCKKRLQLVTSSLQQSQCQGASTSDAFSARLATNANYRPLLIERQYAPVSKNKENRSTVMATSKPDYLQIGSLKMDEINASRDTLNDVLNFSTSTRADAATAKNKILYAMEPLQGSQQFFIGQHLEDHCYWSQNDVMQLSKSTPAISHVPSANVDVNAIGKESLQLVTSPLQPSQWQGASAGVFSSSSPSTKTGRQQLAAVLYSAASENAVNSSAATGTSQLCYMQHRSAVMDKIDIQRKNASGALNNNPTTSTSMPVVAANSEIQDKLEAQGIDGFNLIHDPDEEEVNQDGYMEWVDEGQPSKAVEPPPGPGRDTVENLLMEVLDSVDLDSLKRTYDMVDENFDINFTSFE